MPNLVRNMLCEASMEWKEILRSFMLIPACRQDILRPSHPKTSSPHLQAHLLRRYPQVIHRSPHLTHCPTRPRKLRKSLQVRCSTPPVLPVLEHEALLCATL